MALSSTLRIRLRRRRPINANPQEQKGQGARSSPFRFSKRSLRSTRQSKRSDSTSSASIAIDSVKVPKRFPSDPSSFTRGSLTLQEILRNEDTLAAFLCFCKSQYAAENLLFWLHVEAFKTLVNDASTAANSQQLDPNTVLNKALEVHNRFLKQDAPDWVCLENETTKEITKRLAGNLTEVNSSLFDKAQTETRRTLESDIIPRFIKSSVMSNKFQIEESLQEELKSLLREEVSQ